jgi:hypothetical protein
VAGSCKQDNEHGSYLLGDPIQKQRLGKQRMILEDNIKMYLMKIGCEDGR